ncbi:MAG: TIGR02444 family protein [Porticoccaceae bacterium]
MAETDRTGFWEFACQLYRCQEVEESCLWLQDNADIDVVLLLCCCWAGREYDAIDRRMMAALLDNCQRWSSAVIKPLRTARRWLRNQPGTDASLYEQLKNAELAAERQLMQRLEQQLQSQMARSPIDPARVRDNAKKNTGLYLTLAEIDVHVDTERTLQRLFAAL